MAYQQLFPGSIYKGKTGMWLIFHRVTGVGLSLSSLQYNINSIDFPGPEI